MIRYYQLTPEILLEYVYDGDPKLDEDGIKGNKKDISDSSPTILLKSNAFGSRYLCFDDKNGVESKPESERLVSFSNLVLPLNNTDTQFVIAKSDYQNFYSKLNASNRYSSKNGGGFIYEDTKYDESIRVSGNGENGSCDVNYNKCIVHFTSRNFFGDYDSLIFQAYVYMKNKAKLYFASFLFKRTSNLELKREHLLYNEKLYTTQIEFDIPSVFSIISNDLPDDGDSESDNNGNKIFVDLLRSQNIELLENTPIGINIYGVTGSVKGVDNYVRLKTLKINSISIPCVNNRLDEIYIDIKESDDGDYYEITPMMRSTEQTFVDYIESMGEDIREYMVMHELYLREAYVDGDGLYHSDITHKECHIITINEDDSDEMISKAFNNPIKYRPICVNSAFNCKATIIDTIKIVNTVDNTSYVVEGSLEIAKPYKYGLKLKTVEVNRPIVNVYNKKVSDEKNTGTNGINLSRGGGFVVENNSQNITSFIECTNVGVSILEISPEEIN